MGGVPMNKRYELYAQEFSYVVPLSMKDESTRAFLRDFESIKGCSYRVGNTIALNGSEITFVTLSIDHRKRKSKEVVVRGGRPIGSTKRVSNDLTVGEAYNYIELQKHSTKDLTALLNSKNLEKPISLRTVQRHIADAKVQEIWTLDNTSSFCSIKSVKK